MEPSGLASSEVQGDTTSDDVLDGILAVCKGLFAKERHQAAVNLQRAERERDEARAELRDLKLQMASRPHQDSFAGLQNTMVVCLIDADGAIPQFNRLKEGFSGGQQAAKDLRAYLLNYIEAEGISGTNVSVIVSAYCNQKGLRDTLIGGGHCDNAQFWQFWNGFQSAGLFCMIDVGQKKEAADAKIHAAMLLYARMPQVSRLFLGVTHDGGYHHPLSTLINEGLVEKVVLLRSFLGELPLDLRDLRLRECQLDGLFLESKLQTPRRPKTTSLPPTPQIAPVKGGHFRSNSFATGSPGRTPSHDNELPLSGEGSEPLRTNHHPVPWMGNSDKDVPPNLLDAEHESTTAEAFTQDISMPLLSDDNLAQPIEDIGDGDVEDFEPAMSPPTIFISDSSPNALADTDRVIHGTHSGLVGPDIDPLTESRSDIHSVTGDESTIHAVSDYGNGKRRAALRKGVKPCAFYYCLGLCVRGSTCYYPHNLTLNAEELDKLRDWARSTPLSPCRDLQGPELQVPSAHALRREYMTPCMSGVLSLIPGSGYCSDVQSNFL